MSSTPHPSIPGVTVREHRYIDNAAWFETEGQVLAVSADPKDNTIFVGRVDWRSPEEIRTLIVMLTAAADWLAAQGATT